MITSIYYIMICMRRKYVNNVFFASIFAEIRKKAVPLHVFCKTCVKTIKTYGLCEQKI